MNLLECVVEAACIGCHLDQPMNLGPLARSTAISAAKPYRATDKVPGVPLLIVGWALPTIIEDLDAMFDVVGHAHPTLC